MDQPSANGFQMDPPMTGKPYLGDVSTVNALIADFTRRTLAILDEFNAGGMGRDESIALVNALCMEHGRIFLGEDDRYQPAPWHGARLSGKIRALVPGVSGTAEQVCAGYFQWIAKQIISVSNALHGGMADEEAGPAIQQGVKDAVEFLLGVVP